jgi:hypothetical protein
LVGAVAVSDARGTVEPIVGSAELERGERLALLGRVGRRETLRDGEEGKEMLETTVGAEKERRRPDGGALVEVTLQRVFAAAGAALNLHVVGSRI